MPTLSTETTELTNRMELWEGRSPAVDADGILRNLIFSHRYITKTASYTVTANETGTVFDTSGATAAVVFTLPAIASARPWNFSFANLSDVDMTVAAAAVNTLITYNNLSTADSVAFSTSSEKIGGVVDVYCNGSKLWAVARMGDPRYQTLTITTS